MREVNYFKHPHPILVINQAKVWACKQLFRLEHIGPTIIYPPLSLTHIHICDAARTQKSQNIGMSEPFVLNLSGQRIYPVDIVRARTSFRVVIEWRQCGLPSRQERQPPATI